MEPDEQTPHEETESSEELPDSAGTLTATFSRGDNQYGNDRLSYVFTTTDLQKDWPTIRHYVKRFDRVIDVEITKRTKIKNEQPQRGRGRPRKAVALATEVSSVLPSN